jgi:hypothetical protein
MLKIVIRFIVKAFYISHKSLWIIFVLRIFGCCIFHNLLDLEYVPTVRIRTVQQVLYTVESPQMLPSDVQGRTEKQRITLCFQFHNWGILLYGTTVEYTVLLAQK